MRPRGPLDSQHQVSPLPAMEAEEKGRVFRFRIRSGAFEVKTRPAVALRTEVYVGYQGTRNAATQKTGDLEHCLGLWELGMRANDKRRPSEW